MRKVEELRESKEGKQLLEAAQPACLPLSLSKVHSQRLHFRTRKGLYIYASLTPPGKQKWYQNYRD